MTEATDLSVSDHVPDALDAWLGMPHLSGLLPPAAVEAIRQRFLVLGAAVANLEARMQELEAHPAVSIPPLGAGPLEPDIGAPQDG